MEWGGLRDGIAKAVTERIGLIRRERKRKDINTYTNKIRNQLMAEEFRNRID